MNEKGIKPLFYPHDTHWNDRGQYFGCQKIARVLRIRGADYVAPRNLDEFKSDNENRFGDLWRYLGLEDDVYLNVEVLQPYTDWSVKPVGVKAPKFPWLPGPNNRHKLIVKIAKDRNERNLVVFHDSFFQPPFPDFLMAEQFSNSLFLRAQIEEYSMKEIVDQFHPKVVMEIRLERWIYTPKPVDIESADVK
jgi:hypothetical protein